MIKCVSSKIISTTWIMFDHKNYIKHFKNTTFELHKELKNTSVKEQITFRLKLQWISTTHLLEYLKFKSLSIPRIGEGIKKLKLSSIAGRK